MAKIREILFEDDVERMVFTRTYLRFQLVTLLAAGGVYGAWKSDNLKNGFITLLIGSAISFAIPYIRLLMIRETGNFFYWLLHPGRKVADHKAIIAGLYNQAHGHKLSGDHDSALNAYKEILAAYPEELRAEYQIAVMYEENFDEPYKAMHRYKKLAGKIKREELDAPFAEPLAERMERVKAEIERMQDGE